MQFLSLCAVALLLGACGKSAENSYQPSLAAKSEHEVKEYVVGIHPLHNPQRLMELYGPIIDYISLSIPEAHFKLEASRNYEEFDKKLKSGYFDFAMPNPYQTILSLKHGYRIFGKMSDDNNFRGIILVRKDSGIRKVADLKGKAVSYPTELALAATLQPQYYLQTHGLDVNRDIENRYVGSQESSIMNVYRGHVAAGATWPMPWNIFALEHPEMAGELMIQWETEELVNNGWVVRKNVSVPIAIKFAEQLFGMHKSTQGQAILAQLQLSHFEPATEKDYLPVRNFLAKFSRTVRQIEQ